MSLIPCQGQPRKKPGPGLEAGKLIVLLFAIYKSKIFNSTFAPECVPYLATEQIKHEMYGGKQKIKLLSLWKL